MISQCSFLFFYKHTDGTLKDWNFFMNINVLAQCVCSREAYQSMTKNNINGHIIQINRYEQKFHIMRDVFFKIVTVWQKTLTINQLAFYVYLLVLVSVAIRSLRIMHTKCITLLKQQLPFCAKVSGMNLVL